MQNKLTEDEEAPHYLKKHRAMEQAKSGGAASTSVKAGQGNRDGRLGNDEEEADGSVGTGWSLEKLQDLQRQKERFEQFQKEQSEMQQQQQQAGGSGGAAGQNQVRGHWA
jgi:hypothetical protein